MHHAVDGSPPHLSTYFEVLAKVGCFGHQQGRWRGDVETAAGDGRGCDEALEDLWFSQGDRTVRSPCLCRNNQAQARGYLESHLVIVHTRLAWEEADRMSGRTDLGKPNEGGEQEHRLHSSGAEIRGADQRPITISAM